ncbi:MAG: hypothetical protein FWF01_01235, partial [Alphaproteobacteria bacterium]|nr:hypothetical protein [Alphaproteobacteria bacterium]
PSEPSQNIGARTQQYNQLLQNVARNAAGGNVPSVSSVLSTLNNVSVNAPAGNAPANNPAAALTQILMGFDPKDIMQHAISKTQKRTRPGWIPYVLFDIAQTANVAGVLVPSVIANSGTKAMKSASNVKKTQAVGAPSPAVYPAQASEQAQATARTISDWTRDGQMVPGEEDVPAIRRSLIEAFFIRGNYSNPYVSGSGTQQPAQIQRGRGTLWARLVKPLGATTQQPTQTHLPGNQPSARFTGISQQELNRMIADRQTALSRASRESFGKAAEQLKKVEEMMEKMEAVQEAAKNSNNMNADLLVNAMAIQLQNMVIIRNILAQSQTLGVNGLNILSKSASFTVENPNNIFPEGRLGTKNEGATQ